MADKASTNGTNPTWMFFLLSCIRTGDPIIDSIFLVVLTTCFGNINTIVSIISDIFSSKTSKMFVHRHDIRRYYSERNKVFDSIQWYISNQKNKSRELEAMREDDEELILSIAKNSLHTVVYRGERVTITYVFQQAMGQNNIIIVKELMELEYAGSG